MYSIEQIKQPVETEMNLFEQKFKTFMASSVPLLDKITHYIVKRKGKQLRPLFVFLCAKVNGEINDTTYRAASLIELLHTATLVHDDVVDDSNERRGFFSINALWKNKIAVLVGDYLLSKGLLLSLDNNDFELLKIVSTAVREMSEGELLQIEKARKLDIEEPIYFEIIRKKTASLIASCCAGGSHSVGASADRIEAMRRFGELVGIAFQIKDDLFDYGTADIGKPTGSDIKEKKMTLPLIYSLQQASWLEKRRIINAVKNNNNDPKRVKEVIDFVHKSGGIKYAETKMHELKDQAIQLLRTFPESAAREALENLVLYTVNRKK
ncbi:MAG: polyprenyl synthetase family protein [Bacteroidetes bacterium]|nr:polyprenyl synthetase family protein [Bacteroidota bacterium]MBK9799301.1 polyprenyl synthetase family protein [Bacteroidota bacterium]MBP6411846.1 polyprenyl synthetase family protein [Bacteroidia bacterium]